MVGLASLLIVLVLVVAIIIADQVAKMMGWWE